MSSINRRAVLTAMAGGCVAAAALAATAGSAVATVPRGLPLGPAPDSPEAGPEPADGEAMLHQAQYIIIRRRPRRRWFFYRRWRRRYYW